MSKTKLIAYMAVTTAIGVVLNIVSIPTGTFFGTVSFVYVFCFFAGILFGPVKGGIVSALADVLQCIIAPKGPWAPQITISNALLSVIMGLAFYLLRDRVCSMAARIAVGASVSFPICSLALTSWGITMYSFGFMKTAARWGESMGISSPYIMVVIYRAATQWFWLALSCVILWLLFKRLSKFFRSQGFSIGASMVTASTAEPAVDSGDIAADSANDEDTTPVEKDC